MARPIENQFNWQLPIYGGLGGMLVVLPMIVFGNDIGPFLISIVIAAIVSIIVIVFAIRKARRQALAAVSMLLLFCSVSWLSLRFSNDIRTTGRWLVRSRAYKAAVLARPSPLSNQFKHMEWDGWGFPGAGDTVVYLVFDQSDSLALPARSHSAGKFAGIPCAVPEVRRLESHWYTVLFYTAADWEHCS
jgi:hypothetical protein